MFSFAQPWVLLLWPLPLLWHWLLPAAQSRHEAAIKTPFFHTVKTIRVNPYYHGKSSGFSWLLGLAIWSLLLFAASGPQWLGAPTALPQSGRDIMLALDLSGSMRIPDMQLHGRYTDRLDVVKTEARKFIEARKGDRLGLILFGSKAYLQTPLTFDRRTVLQMLNDASIGLAGPETAIGDALGLAIKRLSQAPGKTKVIILLTDGDNNSGVIDPLDAARMAAGLGIKIYTIGIGAKRLVVQGLLGPQVIQPTSALDEKTLKEIARISGGLFFRAENTQDLQHVYENLNQLEPVVSGKNIFRPVKPLYPWPLSMALTLALAMGFRRIYGEPKPPGAG